MYDIVGDIHGCADELEMLLFSLGYKKNKYWYHPEGRTFVSAGDICDRGPKTPETFKIIMDMCERGFALAVEGNHDNKLQRYLKGNPVKVSGGLAKSVEQLGRCPTEFIERVRTFLLNLPCRLYLNDGRLIVVHAAAPEKYQKIVSDLDGKKAKKYAQYGVTTDETDENGYKKRVDWANDYSGDTIVVHGHVAQLNPSVKNNVYNVDTGCVYGNKLTALRYPEMQFVSVKALKTYKNRELK